MILQKHNFKVQICAVAFPQVSAWEGSRLHGSAHVDLQGDRWIIKDLKGKVLGAQARGVIHHSSQGCFFISMDEERWTSSFQRGELLVPFFLTWLHSALEVFRHKAILPTVILHHPWEESFVPAWHQHICMETSALLGCYNGLHLQQESLNQIRAMCWSHHSQISLPCYFQKLCPSYPSACSQAHGGTEESLLDFLRDDCCLLNNSV